MLNIVIIFLYIYDREITIIRKKNKDLDLHSFTTYLSIGTEILNS